MKILRVMSTDFYAHILSIPYFARKAPSGKPDISQKRMSRSLTDQRPARGERYRFIFIYLIMDMSCILCSSRRKDPFGYAVCDVERHEGEQAEFCKEYEDRECFCI